VEAVPPGKTLPRQLYTCGGMDGEGIEITDRCCLDHLTEWSRCHNSWSCCYDFTTGRHLMTDELNACCRPIPAHQWQHITGVQQPYISLL